MIEKESFKSAWRKFATGVAVITTIEPTGQIHGMTANSVASISLNPLLIMASVGHERESNRLIKKTGRFALSVLSNKQRDVAIYYSTTRDQDLESSPVDFIFTKNGSGIVPDCLSFMDCHTVNQHEVGDHTIFIASVDELGTSQGQPLTYYNGTYQFK